MERRKWQRNWVEGREEEKERKEEKAGGKRCQETQPLLKFLAFYLLSFLYVRFKS